MLEDPFMLAQMEEAIDNGSVAEAAVDSICTMFINMFSGVDDELTRQRASDVKDIRDSLLRILLGVKVWIFHPYRRALFSSPRISPRP